ncbi:MAG: FAD-binding protein [Methylobacteriaceae bacterium]|jgi:electron transfer flavoprotein alpha subunit|nr:FAD-binding protein [Methylobacteriaceae bacterium]
MKTLMIVEQRGGEPASDTARVLCAAKQLGGPVDALVFGEGAAAAAKRVAGFPGVENVMVALGDSLKDGLAEPAAEFLSGFVENHEAVVVSASRFGKNLLPRLAALLGVPQVSDVTRILSADTFERPIYAGNAIETVKLAAFPKLLTIRATAFESAPETGGAAAVRQTTWDGTNTLSRFIGFIPSLQEGAELGSARTVVAFGRALETRENVETLIMPLVKELNAAVGATRAAVEAGLAPNDWQIGQTGRIIAPELYIGVGLSGAVQHTAGIRGAKTIVAVNIDESAPIFSMADYALVGDLHTVIPELIAAFRQKK